MSAVQTIPRGSLGAGRGRASPWVFGSWRQWSRTHPVSIVRSYGALIWLLDCSIELLRSGWSEILYLENKKEFLTQCCQICFSKKICFSKILIFFGKILIFPENLDFFENFQKYFFENFQNHFLKKLPIVIG